jgi:glycosyltransferase involved in cell wall biosynthesis
MKIIVQIPCYNEERDIGEVIRDVPRKISGVDQVEVMVIDDGSTDRTVEKAKAAGADHILSLRNHKGLAMAFQAGMDRSIELGADVIVNTDGDHQYRGEDIPQLVQPVLSHEADVVIGERPIEEIKEFSWVKKKSQRVGSFIVRKLAGMDVKDVTSGFRAYSREAALRITILTRYTYTWESTIQMGRARLKVTHVPVGINPTLRPSRLIQSKAQYVKFFFATVIRIYAKYEPLKVFSIIGGLFLTFALLLFFRFWYFYAIGEGGGHIQSLIFGAVLALVGIQNFVIGLVADLIAANRLLLEDAHYRIRLQQFEMKKP